MRKTAVISKSLTIYSSLPYWDPSNPANGMAISRMDSLLTLASEETQKPAEKINWLRISSNLFGTVMIHRVINEQVRKASSFYKKLSRYLLTDLTYLLIQGSRVRIIQKMQTNVGKLGHFLEPKYCCTYLGRNVFVEPELTLLDSRGITSNLWSCTSCCGTVELFNRRR